MRYALISWIPFPSRPFPHCHSDSPYTYTHQQHIKTLVSRKDRTQQRRITFRGPVEPVVNINLYLYRPGAAFISIFRSVLAGSPFFKFKFIDIGKCYINETRTNLECQIDKPAQPDIDRRERKFFEGGKGKKPDQNLKWNKTEPHMRRCDDDDFCFGSASFP